MTLGDLVARLTDTLDNAGIPYMLTGSLASSFHGEPRSTRDVDVVIDPSPDSLERLLSSFPADAYYVDGEAARAALAERGQFNVVEQATGWKVDFVIRKERKFSRAEFGRRTWVELPGGPAFVATAEDTIIAKLEWAQAGESERQLRDVASILAVSGDRLDRGYLDRWVGALGLEPMLENAEILARSDLP